MKPCPAKTQPMPNYKQPAGDLKVAKGAERRCQPSHQFGEHRQGIHSPVLWRGAPRNARSDRSAARCTLRFQREQCFLFYTARFLVWFLRKNRQNITRNEIKYIWPYYPQCCLVPVGGICVWHMINTGVSPAYTAKQTNICIEPPLGITQYTHTKISAEKENMAVHHAYTKTHVEVHTRTYFPSLKAYEDC